jgi:CheY-like chemotaxis protein
VDLVDEHHKVIDGGAILLDRIKADPQLREFPVVLYSAKHTEVSLVDLRKRGAKAFIRRKPGWVQEILYEFGIPY